MDTKNKRMERKTERRETNGTRRALISGIGVLFNITIDRMQISKGQLLSSILYCVTESLPELVSSLT